MFKLIRKSYYKAITFWGSKVTHNLDYDYERWEKILEKEPSLYKHCELSMFGSRDFMDKLLSNPRFDKEAFADYLISKISTNKNDIYSLLYQSTFTSDKIIMEKLVKYDGKVFGFVSGDLANDKMYELAKNAKINNFDISTRIFKCRKLSEKSIRWWYGKDKSTIFDMLRNGNAVPMDIIKETLIEGNYSLDDLEGLGLRHLSKEELIELVRIDGRVLICAGDNISIEAYREAINNIDVNKRFGPEYISVMSLLANDLDEQLFLDLCKENGNFFMFFSSHFNLEEAYKIAMSHSDPYKKFDINNYIEYMSRSLHDGKLCKRLVNLDGRFLTAVQFIDLDLYRKAKANGFSISDGFNDRLYYKNLEENIDDYITLMVEEPGLINSVYANFYDEEFNNQLVDKIIARKVEFPFNFEILENMKEDSKKAFNKLMNYYKNALNNNELSKEQLNLLFNYYSSNRKDPFYKFIKSKVCEVYGIDENFLDYQLEYGSRVNKDFGVTLNPEMLQKKYCVLYEGKGHDAYSKLYILGTFPNVQKKIISIGTEIKGESLGNSSRRIELLKKMLDSAIGSDELRESEEWIPKFSHIIQYVNRNIPMFSYFADHLDELDDKKISLLTSHALSLHRFPIRSMDELENYAEVRKKYIEKMYTEGTLSSVKEAFIEECFGMSPLMYKRMLMFKDGVLAARDKYDPEIVKLFEKLALVECVTNPKQFISARNSIDTKELGQFYSENNFRYLHLMMGIKHTILSDYNNSLYHCKDEDYSLEYEGCRLYKVAGEDGSKPFNLSITSLGAYSSFNPFERGFSFKENWNMPLVASHGICSTYLGNNNLGTARVECVILGFTDYEEGALLTGGPYDLGSNASNKTFDAFSNLSNSMFLHPQELIDYTRHTHNEMVFERRYKDGKRQPNYVVLDVDDLSKAMELYEKYNKSGRYVFDRRMKKGFEERDRTEEERQADLVYFALKCSKDFGIPIVVVEREKIAQNEWKKIVVSLKEVMDKKDFSREEVHELLHDIFVDFENNAVGNTYHKHINDKYFNYTNGELLVDSIKSKITVLMRENPVVAGYFLDELESLCSLEMDKLGLYRKNRSNSGIDYNWLGNYVETQRQLLSNSVISTKYVGDLLTGKIGDDECLMEYSSHFKVGDDQLDISDVRKIIVDDDKLAVKFNLAVSMIDTYRLYEDREKTAHSRKHVEDVVLFSTVIGKSLGFDDKDMDLLLAAAVFHDSGRIDDRNVSHAVSSAKLVGDKLIGVFPKEDLAMIQAIIEYHELRDKRTTDGNIDYNQLIDLCEKYGISRQDQEKIDKCIKLSSVLKDADALDRTRFVAKSKAFLNPNYLRHDVSKKLFKVSVQLNEYYSKKDIEQTLTEKPELIDTFKEALDMTKSPKEVIRMYRKGKIVGEEQKESEVVINGTKK